MKNNEKFLDDLEKIPDRFLDEINNPQVKERKFQWSILVSVAACIAAVISVPVIILNSKKPESSIVPMTSEVSEVSVTTSDKETESVYDEKEISNVDYEMQNQSEDIFPEPFFKFYYLTTKTYSQITKEYSYDAEEKYFRINFLKDKEFENQINQEIAELLESMPSEFKYPDSAPSAFHTGINSAEINEEANENPETKDIFIIPCIRNGYFSFMIAGRITDTVTGTERFEHAHSFMYDLVEKKKVNSLNEFFSEENDSEKLIQKYTEEYGHEGEITGFANYNIIYSGKNDESFFVPLNMTFAVENNIPFTRTRDFSEILDEDFITAAEQESVIKWGTETIVCNGTEISYDTLEKSTLYPDSWCEKHNRIKKAVMEDMVKIFEVNGGFTDTNRCYIFSNQCNISDTLLGRNVQNFYRNLCMYYSPSVTMYDTDTVKKINISDIFTEEGTEYISGLSEEKSFADKEYFIDMLNTEQITFRYEKSTVSDTVKMFFSYNSQLNNPESILEADIPAEMMNNRYFDYEKYCEFHQNIRSYK